MSKEISLDNIGGWDDVEDHEHPETHRVAAQPEPEAEPRAIARPPTPLPRPQKGAPLPAPKLPKTAAEEEARPVVPVDELPNDLRASFRLLEKINNLPENSRREKWVKEQRLEKIKAHCHRLQQIPDGPRAVVNPPASVAKSSGLVESIRAKLLKKLGR